MTYFDALEIKVELECAMKFAEYGGKSKADALAEPAKKYSVEQLAEAYAQIKAGMDKEQEFLKAMFVFAIKSKAVAE